CARKGVLEYAMDYW
nr:immunoglobulin heavy chain junction region [Mus musculus]